MSSDLLFPIGLYLGVLHRSLDPADIVQQVRVGSDFHELDEAEFTVWAIAHGHPEVLAEGRPWTSDLVRRLLGEALAPRLDETIEALITRGLLVEVAPESQTKRAFAETYRLVPTLLGLGNAADDPWLFQIGVMGQPLISVTLPVFETWQWSAVAGSLWAACLASSQGAVKAGSSDPAATDPERVLEEVMVAVHLMLASSAAYLDVPFQITVPEELT